LGWVFSKASARGANETQKSFGRGERGNMRKKKVSRYEKGLHPLIRGKERTVKGVVTLPQKDSRGPGGGPAKKKRI